MGIRIIARKRAGQAGAELVDLVGVVAEPVVVRDVVEELLGVEGAAKEEGEAPVRRLDDEADLVNGGGAVERVRVREAVLDVLRERHPRAERLSHLGEQGSIDNRCALGLAPAAGRLGSWGQLHQRSLRGGERPAAVRGGETLLEGAHGRHRLRRLGRAACRGGCDVGQGGERRKGSVDVQLLAARGDRAGWRGGGRSGGRDRGCVWSLGECLVVRVWRRGYITVSGVLLASEQGDAQQRVIVARHYY
jgi:hypothetical protein